MLTSLNKIKELNTRYKRLSIAGRIEALYRDFAPEDIMCTSSFGSNSVFLLHHLAMVKPDQVVHFIDTGNHFKETLTYRDEICSSLGINSKVLTACPEVHRFTRVNEIWKTNPHYCCYLKKTRPIEKLTVKHKVWISGLMEWQSDHRASLDIFEERKGILKFHPLLDQSKADCDSYISICGLPTHPLVGKGYQSIGCTHCTDQGNGRMGRWNGSVKTECGLHL